MQQPRHIIFKEANNEREALPSIIVETVARRAELCNLAACLACRSISVQPSNAGLNSSTLLRMKSDSLDIA